MLLISGKGKQLQTRNDLAKKGISEIEKKNKELINILPPIIIKPSASAKGKQKVLVEKNKKPTKQSASRQESTQCLPNRSKTVKEIAEDRLAQAPVDIDNNSCCGTVHVRFNHYNSAFPIHNGGLYFIDLLNDDHFILHLEEDPVAGIGGGCSLKHGNRAVSLLTSDLKAIKPSDLNSAEAKDLLERRDLEDILYS
eukprot:gene30644-39918_t